MNVYKSKISIFNIIHSALISSSLILILNSAFGLEDYPVLSFVYVAVFTLIIFLFFAGSNTMRYVLALSALSMIFFILLIYTRGSIKGAIYNVYNFFKWSIDYLSGYQNSHDIFSPCLTIMMSFIITLFVYIFTVQRESFIPVLILGCIILTVQHVYELPSNIAGFYMLLFLMLVQYVKKSNYNIRLNKPGNYITFQHFIAWSIPICVIALILSIRIPESSRPIQWNWLDSKINKLFGVYGYTYVPEYAFSRVGFGNDDNSLGGDIFLDDNTVMKVTSPRFTYLKGASRDFYTGSSWITTDRSITPADDKYNSVNIDTLEMKKCLGLLTGEGSIDQNFITQNFHLDTITVVFENLQTKSLFIPSKMNNITFGKNTKDDIYANSDGVLLSKKINKKDFSYSIEVYSPIYNSESFINVLRKSKTGLYDENGSKFYALSSNSDMEAIYSNYLKIKSKYLQLPQTLPSRVKELALNITSDAQNNYDKIKAIEKFLISSYTYTLTPGIQPKDVDFVDYFLFSLRKGYCIYFASAMTVLARCIGIPARYVEGYMLPPSPTSGKTYVVTNKLAHAWTEVYFEGYGWLAFEPTPQYNQLFYLAPAAKSGTEQQTYAAVYSGGSGEYNEYIEELLDEIFEDIYMPEEKQSILIFILLPIVFLAAVTLLLIFINQRRVSIREWKLRKMPPREGIISTYENIIRNLAILGMPIKPNETSREYALRLAQSPETSIEGFSHATNIFEKARYGLEDCVDSRDRDDLLRFYINMCDFEIQRLGKIKYFIYHNLLGII